MSQNPYINSLLSTVNVSSTALNNAATFTGTWEEQIGYGEVSVYVRTNQTCTLYMEFSSDAITTDRSTAFSVIANDTRTFRDDYIARYFRVRLTNDSGSNQTYLTLQSFFKNHTVQTSPINSTLAPDADASVSRSILYGSKDDGQYREVNVSGEGHLEVALHSPRLPFGSIHTENITPIFQHDAVYSIDTVQNIVTTSGTGTATTSDSSFVVTTGVTSLSQGIIQSRRRLRYRPGQGVILRFAGGFTTPVTSSYQLMGMGHAEDGLYFGYKNTDFGILYVQRGVRETRTLTITTGSSTAENVTVRLNGTNYSVAVTNSGNTFRTAYEISLGTYAGWSAEVLGATVIFLSNSSGAKNTGTYTLTGSTAVGSFATTKAGVDSTDEFIKQSDWNGDKLNGTGATGSILDPTKYNVFQIKMQYLGAGTITFDIEVSVIGKNPEWITVHTLRLPNTLTRSSVGNPCFPFTMAAYSTGSTTNLSVKCSSYGGFIEGGKFLHGNRLSYTGQKSSVNAAAYYAIFTIKNSLYFQGRSNQVVVNILSIAGALKHNNPCTIYLFRNATLAGNPNFSFYNTSSATQLDSSATTCTISSNHQLIYSASLGDTGNFDKDFLQDTISIQPGESVTLAARTAFGTASYVIASLNTREDQ